MLTVKPIQEKSEQKLLCALCGAPYREEYFMYGAKVDEKCVGVCQFIIRGNYGYISEFSKAEGTDDGEAMFILGRATLNFLDIAGAHEVFFEGEPTPLVQAVGFKEKDGKYYINLNGFFNNPCKNKK